MTNQEIRQRIRSAIRQVWTRYSDERRQVLAEARRYYKAYNKDGTPSKRPKVMFVCAICKQEHKSTEIEVDHIAPVGETPSFPPNDSSSWDKWLQKLFCKVDNLRCLCVGCHRKITAEQRRKKRAISKIRRHRSKTKRRTKRRIKVA